MTDDQWSLTGANILASEQLAKIERVLKEQGPIILEHRFYRGARAPDRLVFDDFDEFFAYLKSQARPGDSFWVWNYAELCKDNNELARGKYPDASGRVPLLGSY